MSKNNRRHGQIGLILLVLMGVVIAMALSLASRSLSDTVLSRQEQESSEAFRMAETGVEQAMNAIRIDSTPGSGAQLPANGIFSGNYAINSLNSYALYVKEGEQASLDLTGFNSANNLTIAWTRTADGSENLTCSGEGSGNAPAGLEVMAVAGNSSPATAQFIYYKPASCGLVSPPGFIGASPGSAPYRSTVDYNVPNNTTAVRIRPLYAPATISVTGSGLTTQLYLIQSQASGGDARKEIEVKRGLAAPASMFDFALFAGGTIVK